MKLYPYFFLALTIICAVIEPVSLVITIPLATIHLVMFVLNIHTDYKYCIISTTTKIIFGAAVPPFLLIFVDYPITLMMVNTILFMVVTVLPNISRMLKHMEPRTITSASINPYTYSHFNRPGMHHPPNVVYMQPQQPYYAILPNMQNNIPRD